MIVTGTAGWSIPKAIATGFAGQGTHLQRYARVLHCAEINTSFYRPHKRETYEKWSRSVPDGFRFSVKLPRAITHEHRLRGTRALLDEFLAQVGGLGDRLGPLLVQMPPSLRFDRRAAGGFFDLLCELHPGAVVCEPRHLSWFEPDATALMARLHIGRVAADPAMVPEAAAPGGWTGPGHEGAGATLYYRWHGSPRMYWSAYEAGQLDAWAESVHGWPAEADVWCVFDNTASGAAIENALAFDERVRRLRSRPSR